MTPKNKEGLPFPFPRCAICQTPVERIDGHDRADPFDYRKTLVVYCHGEREIVEIPADMVEAIQLGNADIRIGDAFSVHHNMPLVRP